MRKLIFILAILSVFACVRKRLDINYKTWHCIDDNAENLSKNKFGGIGIVIELCSNGVLIKDILPNTPASKSELGKGDIIIEVDTISMKSLPLKEVISLVRGEVGSEVALKVLRTGIPTPVNIALKRDIIKINNNPYTISLPPTNAKEKAQYAYTVKALDIDGDKLAFKLIKCPDGMIINEDTGEITWMPTSNHLGFNEIKIEVTDGNGGIDFQEYTLFVVNSWNRDLPPQIISTTKSTITAYEEFIYPVKAYDIDGCVLKYWLGHHPENMEINETTGVIRWVPTIDQLGTNSVQVGVTKNNQKRFISDGTNCQLINLVVVTDWYKDMDNDGYSDGTVMTRSDRLKGYYLPSELKSTYGDPDDTDPSQKP